MRDRHFWQWRSISTQISLFLPLHWWCRNYRMLFKVLNIGRNTERRFQMAPSKLEAMTTALTSLACPAWSGWGPKKCLRNEHENQTISNEKDVTTVTKAKGAKQTGGYDDRLGLFSLSSLVNPCGLFAMPCQRETETKCDDDPQENACINSRYWQAILDEVPSFWKPALDNICGLRGPRWVQMTEKNLNTSWVAKRRLGKNKSLMRGQVSFFGIIIWRKLKIECNFSLHREIQESRDDS